MERAQNTTTWSQLPLTRLRGMSTTKFLQIQSEIKLMSLIRSTISTHSSEEFQ